MDDPSLKTFPNPDDRRDHDQPAPGIARRLQTLLQEIYDSQQAIILTMQAAEQDLSGTPGKWSLKDTLAHIATWNDMLNMRLELSARGETPPDLDDVDRINAEFHQARRGLSWSAVMEASRKSYVELVARIESMDEAELTDPARFAWLGSEPLWKRILRTGYIHPLTHLANYYVQRGQKALGLQLQEDAAAKLLALDPSPDWQSKTIYSLACQYALNGEKTTAISKLRQALHIDRGLLAWSQQDPDFNSIRDDPDFQMIYTGMDDQSIMS